MSAEGPQEARGPGSTMTRHFGSAREVGMSERFSDRSRLWEHVPFAVVVLVTALGLLRIAMHAWREGSVWLSLALLLAAGMRAVLASDQVGLLAVRSRTVDMVLYGGFGLLLLAVALTIVGGPLAF